MTYIHPGFFFEYHTKEDLPEITPKLAMQKIFIRSGEIRYKYNTTDTRPKKNEEFKKLYWHISEVADFLKESNSTIRYWCNELGLNPKSHIKRDRNFTEKEFNRMKYAQHLIRVEGLHFWKIKELIKDNKI